MFGIFWVYLLWLGHFGSMTYFFVVAFVQCRGPNIYLEDVRQFHHFENARVCWESIRRAPGVMNVEFICSFGLSVVGVAAMGA